MTMQRPAIIYGTAWKEHETTRTVALALQTGFRAIDTANQPKHYQEALVGEALAASGLPRQSLFLQTKFTPLDGQDARVPYDPQADVAAQVRQSFASSLTNLRTEYLDAYLLHGPYSHPGLGASDWAVWREMEQLVRDGRVREIGISNVNSQQLAELHEKANIKPTIVQNRCYANRGWDGSVRSFCRSNGIVYQAFSLLTANPAVVGHPFVQKLAQSKHRTPAQVIFRFSMLAGMTPLTGTTNAQHMHEALTSVELQLDDRELQTIEALC